MGKISTEVIRQQLNYKSEFTMHKQTNQNNTIHNRINDLINYVHELGRRKQKVFFTLEEYKELSIWDYNLEGKIGIEYQIDDNSDTPIWLKIKRLIRISPPLIPESIQDWIVVDNSPSKPPEIKKALQKKSSKQEVDYLVKKKLVLENDISESFNEQNNSVELKVTLHLENNPQAQKNIARYLEDWQHWAEEEKPRRETIKIYESLFSLQQIIESQGDEQAIELIWGIGISRWLCDGHKIEHPIIEKAVEIDIDKQDASILIRPRNTEPAIADGPYYALDNPKIGDLVEFSTEYFAKQADEIEFSPFTEESFVSVLTEAATNLSQDGVYQPQEAFGKKARQPIKTNETLTITNNWVIFSRPRSTTAFIQDIERLQKAFIKLRREGQAIANPVKKLVSELSTQQTASNHTTQTKPQLFLPKVYNESQVDIINRLETNDAVVVQGPPGTGKTHTIANIICHYLATGRRVLVTSKGESALTVLQAQIPETLRALTISLLTSEKQGMKQLEQAITLLSNMVKQSDPITLQKEADSKQLRVDALKAKIATIDQQIEEWGKKQINPIDGTLKNAAEDTTTAMELAQLVVAEQDGHQWLPDTLENSTQPTPLFTNYDIENIRELRKKADKHVVYANQSLPETQALPDSANIAAIHADLLSLTRLKTSAQQNRVPSLALSVEQAIPRAQDLVSVLQELGQLQTQFVGNPWLKPLFHLWLKKSTNTLVDELYTHLSKIIERRQLFVKTLVEISNPNNFLAPVLKALSNLSNNKRAFGFFSFGNQEAKKIIADARVDGEFPQDNKQWQLILIYIEYQNNVRKFISQWNHISQEFDLPKFTYQYGDNFRALQDCYDLMSQAKIMAEKSSSIYQEITTLFPHGINANTLFNSQKEIEKAIEAIQVNIAQDTFANKRNSLDNLIRILNQSDGEIVENIKHFLTNTLGNNQYSTSDIKQQWQNLSTELGKINELRPCFDQIKTITKKISASGAPIWANKLLTQPPLAHDDELTPNNWAKTWQWKQRKRFLQSIDGRNALKKLSNQRSQFDRELKKTFSELVYLKTNIGLHSSMTESVQGALNRFTTAISKVGTGKGKRAPRHRRTAYRAMEECYAGVPCWIMPVWRISENLPSEFASFDLVIIDEASQSDITALPAILRAKKLLIVGDDKQVSPTADFVKESDILQFTHNFLSDIPYPELFVPGASIYDLASTLFPTQRIMLTEHFRCVEPIIRFSMQFYPQALIPLRIAKASEKLTPPLVDVYVAGGKRHETRRINALEAKAIVAEIKSLVSEEKYKTRSIGIISLIGWHQARYIQDELLREIGEEVFRRHRIVCGDAATFQGKERDIIFLSMVVGAGQGRAMTQKSNEQRVNVALSRARDRMYLYRSIQQSDLSNQNDLRLKILQHMASPTAKQISTPASTGSNSPAPKDKPVENPLDLCDSDFERDVYQRLVKKGYRVTPQVKVGSFSIDLVVEGDNDRRLAVELDGDRYHPPEQWMDDWRRQRTMERVGWTFWRCWGSSYLLDPEGCLADLLGVLEDMQIYPSIQDSIDRLPS